MGKAGQGVAVVESQVLFAKALCGILSSDPAFTVLGDYRSAAQFSAPAAQLDMIVLDLDGQASDVAAVLATWRALAPEASLCVLSMSLAPERLARCLAAGASAYIIKDISPDELLRALRTVAAGASYVDPRVAGGLLRRRASGQILALELSQREAEVLKLIAEGLANKQISARLQVSEKTVKNHVSRIFSKLNITARSQAAVHAIRAGFV